MQNDDPARLQAIGLLYKEQCDHGRHTEMQRHALSAMLLTLTGALLAAMAILRFSLAALPLAVLIAFLGGLGWKFVDIYAKKWTESGARRDHYRLELEDRADIPPAPGSETRGSLRRLWKAVFGLVIGLGLACAALTVAISPCGYDLGLTACLMTD